MVCIFPFALQYNFGKVLPLKDMGVHSATLIHIVPCIASFNDRSDLHQKSILILNALPLQLSNKSTPNLAPNMLVVHNSPFK